jgi:hypothetical protein
LGTINGLKVPTHPISLKTKKSGISVTGKGIIIVLSVSTNQKSRPHQRSRAKA